METLIVNLINEQKQTNKLSKQQIKLTKKQNKLFKKVLMLSIASDEICMHNSFTSTSDESKSQRTPSSILSKKHGYTEEELCTVDEACAMMNVSRSTIGRLRDEGKLTSLDKNGRVRLIKAEVEEAKIWYSKRKGKL